MLRGQKIRVKPGEETGEGRGEEVKRESGKGELRLKIEMEWNRKG